MDVGGQVLEAHNMTHLPMAPLNGANSTHTARQMMGVDAWWDSREVICNWRACHGMTLRAWFPALCSKVFVQ